MWGVRRLWADSFPRPADIRFPRPAGIRRFARHSVAGSRWLTEIAGQREPRGPGRLNAVLRTVAPT